MTLEIQTKQINVNASSDFTFTNTIQECLIGISYFKLSYGDSDHWVKNVSLSLNQQQPDSKTINVQVLGNLSDSSGHTIDTSDSSATVVVVAWTGTADHTLLLANGDANTVFTLPSSSTTILSATLAGFDLAYDTDHYIAQISVSTINVSRNGNTASLSATENMTDRDGNWASTATFNAGLIASSNASPGFEVKPTSNVYNDTNQSFTFNGAWTNVQAMITGFNVEYSNNKGHWLKEIEVNLYCDSANTVYAVSSMCDNDGNWQSNENSFVNGIVIGY